MKALVIMIIAVDVLAAGEGAFRGRGRSGGGSRSDGPGHGVGKSTYSCNDPIHAWEFLNRYFPVDTPSDECDGNICVCPASGGVPEWTIQQGRVYLKQSQWTILQGRRLPSSGNGFGLHCVNVTNHLTTGGLSTAEVEAQFANKLGDMTVFDSFMDFSVSLHTSDLAGYATAFDEDGIPFYSTTWKSASDDTARSYTSLIVHVPNSQMVLELVSDEDISGLKRPVHASSLHERRASPRALALLEELSARKSSIGSILTPLSVNRAVSSEVLAKLDDFYVTGMGTTKVSHDLDEIRGYSRQCYQWPQAQVDVCFTNRPDSATKGSWKVSDFENMLAAVHKNILFGYPFCGIDKWEDNHYAVSARHTNTQTLVDYINKNSVPHLCESSGLHYIFDPTGWGIQLTNLPSGALPQDCRHAPKSRRRGHVNPACDPGTCKHDNIFV